MGQKTHPYGLRLGIIKPWRSNWFAEKGFAELLGEDLMLRRYIQQRLQRAGVSRINIERQPKRVTIEVHTARPGIAIASSTEPLLSTTFRAAICWLMPSPVYWIGIGSNRRTCYHQRCCCR